MNTSIAEHTVVQKTNNHEERTVNRLEEVRAKIDEHRKNPHNGSTASALIKYAGMDHTENCTLRSQHYCNCGVRAASNYVHDHIHV